MALLKKRTIVIPKFETTEGVAVAFGGSEPRVLAYDVNFKPEVTLLERNIIGPSFARKTSLIAVKMARITFKTDVAGSGTAATEPGWGVLLRACGVKSTVAAQIDYDPVTNVAWSANGLNGGGTLTLNVYTDGILNQAVGCRGTFRLVGEAAGVARFEWEFLGVLSDATDVTFPSLSPIDTTVPPIVAVSNFTFFSSVNLVVKTFTIDFGNALTTRLDATRTSGVRSIIVSDRRVTGNIDPELTSVATFSALNVLKAGSIGSLSLDIGSTTGNKISISSPAAVVQIADVTDGERDNFVVSSIGLQFNVPMIEDSVNKELRISHV